ncbi:MAG: hypothetical protein U1F00_10860 [Rhodoferax sp.]
MLQDYEVRARQGPRQPAHHRRACWKNILIPIVTVIALQFGARGSRVRDRHRIDLRLPASAS